MFRSLNTILFFYVVSGVVLFGSAGRLNLPFFWAYLLLVVLSSIFVVVLLFRRSPDLLKERRKPLLVVRETPLHAGHLRLMLEATEHGAVILPPMPAFYHLPKTVDEIIDHTIVKILDQFGIHLDLVRRWRGLSGDAASS